MFARATGKVAKQKRRIAKQLLQLISWVSINLPDDTILPSLCRINNGYFSGRTITHSFSQKFSDPKLTPDDVTCTALCELVESGFVEKLRKVIKEKVVEKKKLAQKLVHVRVPKSL